MRLNQYLQYCLTTVYIVHIKLFYTRCVPIYIYLDLIEKKCEQVSFFFSVNDKKNLLLLFLILYSSKFFVLAEQIKPSVIGAGCISCTQIYFLIWSSFAKYHHVINLVLLINKPCINEFAQKLVCAVGLRCFLLSQSLNS